MNIRHPIQGTLTLWRILLLTLLALVLAADVAAQGGGPGGSVTEGPRPPRLLEREAPQREPRILGCTATSEGLANTVIELSAEADTYVASEWPDQNFGADALYLGYNLAEENNFGTERVLLRFDVAGNIPQGAVVNDARLRLYLSFSSPSGDAPMGSILRQLDSTWSEGGVTWNSEPTWGPIRAENDVGSVIGWYEWDCHHPARMPDPLGDGLIRETRERHAVKSQVAL
jgi:hypothetical protein